MFQGLGADMDGVTANEICRGAAHMVADLRSRKQWVPRTVRLFSSRVAWSEYEPTAL